MTLEKKLILNASAEGTPISANIELTTQCNMNCKMCYAKMTQKSMPSLTEWLSFIRQIKQEGTLFVLLTGGEPLLHPYFKEIYLALLQEGMIVSVNSNGTLLDEKWTEFFAVNRPRQINITLYGTSEQTYELVCGYSEGFLKAIAAVKRLKEREIPVRLNGTLVLDNQSEYEQMKKLATDMGIQMKVDSYLFPYSRIDGGKNILANRLNPEEQAKYRLCEMKLQKDFIKHKQYACEIQDRMKKKECASFDEQMKCRAGISSYWVNASMEILPCIFLPDAAIPWNGDFHLAWVRCREWMGQIRLYEDCYSCWYKPLCNVCPAAIYAETKDVKRKSAYLCQSAKCYAEELIKDKG